MVNHINFKQLKSSLLQRSIRETTYNSWITSEYYKNKNLLTTSKKIFKQLLNTRSRVLEKGEYILTNEQLNNIHKKF